MHYAHAEGYWHCSTLFRRVALQLYAMLLPYSILLVQFCGVESSLMGLEVYLSASTECSYLSESTEHSYWCASARTIGHATILRPCGYDCRKQACDTAVAVVLLLTITAAVAVARRSSSSSSFHTVHECMKLWCKWGSCSSSEDVTTSSAHT
jgi:hypothetical protein